MGCFTTAPSSYQKIKNIIPETDLMYYLYSELWFLFRQVIWGGFLAQDVFAIPERHLSEKKAAMESNARWWAARHFQNHLKERPRDRIYDPNCFHTRLVSVCGGAQLTVPRKHSSDILANGLLLCSSGWFSILLSLLSSEVNMESTKYIGITDPLEMIA